MANGIELPTRELRSNFSCRVNGELYETAKAVLRKNGVSNRQFAEWALRLYLKNANRKATGDEA